MKVVVVVIEVVVAVDSNCCCSGSYSNNSWYISCGLSGGRIRCSNIEVEAVGYK